MFSGSSRGMRDDTATKDTTAGDESLRASWVKLRSHAIGGRGRLGGGLRPEAPKIAAPKIAAFT
jgi:hypothetical protein